MARYVDIDNRFRAGSQIVSEDLILFLSFNFAVTIALSVKGYWDAE